MKICLILDRLRSAHNTGNIFRIAEALGAEIIACGYTPAPPHPKLAKTAMGADRMVRCRTMAGRGRRRPSPADGGICDDSRGRTRAGERIRMEHAV